MRLVNQRDSTSAPSRFSDEKVLEDWELIAQGDKSLIDDGIYKATYKANGKTLSATRDQLNLFYHNKCAYCEKFCKAEIEHYRPKKEVSGEPAHQGYYWLCYEWSNLVPSCRYCNTEGGKGNQFPVLGTRVQSPDWVAGKLDRIRCIAYSAPLADEEACLLHPEMDDPMLYLTCVGSAKKIGVDLKGIDLKGRGDQTISICNLNREDLALDRRTNVVDPAIGALKNMLQMVHIGAIPEQDLGAALVIVFDNWKSLAADEKQNFTLVRKALIHSRTSVEKLIRPFISNPTELDIILTAFQSWKANNP
jgi:hypothetical protein